MATSSPSPASPLATPPTSTMTPPPSPSIPTPDPPTETNANPPESSTVSPPAPPVASPPPDSPTPSEPPPTSPTPVATSPPLVSATSPPPPTADPPAPSVDAPPPSSPPSPPSSTTPTPTNTLPNSPPPPSPPTTIAPPVTSPPSDPQTLPPPPAAETNSPPPPSTETSSPPPPAAETNSPPPPSTETSSPPPPTMETNSPPPSTTKTKSPPPSKSSPPQSSPPPPPVLESQPPESQPPPPSVSGSTYPPPPSTKHTPEPPSSPQSPKSSPSSPSASPSKDSPSTPTSQISPTVSHLSPPPVSSTTLGSLVPSSSANQPSDNSTAGSPSKGGVPMGGIIAIGLMIGFIMLGLISLVVCCIYKRKRKDFKHNGRYIVPSPYGSSPRSDSNLIVKTAVSSSTPFVRTASGSGALSPDSHGGLHSRSWFTYQELYEATNGFALEHLLGEGGFGSVYKGVLTNGKEIAVKQLKIGGNQGEREFQAEVEIISRIHHRHLVSLVGYCMFESKRLLVYEYVPNQTLYYHLHGENRPVMDWATRIKIAVGAARGIAYLHEDCHPRIIHRDIKSSNILLDNKFEARVADFGLAKLALDVDTHVSTRVMGTFGYMAPEYATSGKLTDKSDVYSFGVVLLELLTGRKPVDSSQPLGDESLVEWARPLLSHALETSQVEGLVDPRLEKSYVESELYLMTEAAAACVRHSATKRPRMAQLVRAFDGLSPSDLSNGMRVGQSEVYDSAQQSAEIRWFRRMAFGSQDYSTDCFSEAARNSTGILNPNQNNQGPIFSTQHSRNDLTQQQSQNIYFSSQRIQGSAFSNQLSQDSTLLRQSSQNLAFQQQSSENLTFLGAA